MQIGKTTKEEIRARLAEGWSERRARLEKKRKRVSQACQKWRACERGIEALEQKLGRTLTVKEYKNMKTKYGINPQ